MLSLTGITKSYGGRRVLDDITFDVRPGRLTGSSAATAPERRRRCGSSSASSARTTAR
jgi:ABC-type uncharacterized transport system, ATPase component